MSDTIIDDSVPQLRASRRSFMKWSAATSGAAALVVTTTNLGMPGGPSLAAAAVGDGMAGVDKTVWNSCLANCGSRCPLRLQVKDGTVVRVLPDSTGSDAFGDFNIRACVRGRSQRQRIYNPDRIKRPMRRTGPRGSGQWEEISWKEALDTVASELQRVKKDHGNEAIFFLYGSGTEGGNITQLGTWPRLLNSFGGFLDYYGSYSAAQIVDTARFHYGGYVTSNTFEDAQNSRLQVMFGNNPLETRMSGGGELTVVQKVRSEFGVRTIVIDPRYSETALDVGDEWVPIRPGTDAALVAGLVHTMLAEGLQDQEFLDTYCVGFDEETLPEDAPVNASYRAYVEGKGGDGIEKSAQWAADITGIPAMKIRQLAREMATTKPCAITQGWGVQRQANGENAARSIFTLAAVTGNVGIAGGGNGCREGNYSIPIARFPNFDGEEPPVTTAISCFNWIDAIEHGPEMTALKDGVRGKDKLDVGIKLMVVNASNLLMNQHNDIHRTQKTLSDESKCEFIVVIDHQWTTSCEWGDIVLPATTNFEEADLIPGGRCGDTASAFLGDKVIEPLFDTKTGYDMCTEIAKRLGVEAEFTQGRTQEEWREYLFQETRKAIPDFPTQDELREMGVFRKKNPDGNYIGNQKFREDPQANPLKTPSGKIEIYSQRLYEMSKNWIFEGDRAGDKITALPEHMDTWEGALEARDSKYPLQCISHHFKGRTHSTYANVAWMNDAHRQNLWINPLDASKRDIKNGDVIFVFNERGRVRTEARVTPRIAPGVVSLPQGAWFRPDEDGVDTGGCANTLTKYHPSPMAKANPSHTALVDVERA